MNNVKVKSRSYYLPTCLLDELKSHGCNDTSFKVIQVIDKNILYSVRIKIDKEFYIKT